MPLERGPQILPHTCQSVAHPVLALAGDVKWNTGEVPLQNLPALGNNLRAYSSNRFIDKTRAAGQLEFRVFPWEEGVGSRWGFAAFGEAGQVAEEFKQMQWNETKISYGGGIRYSLFTGDRLNLRVDYAISKGNEFHNHWKKLSKKRKNPV